MIKIIASTFVLLNITFQVLAQEEVLKNIKAGFKSGNATVVSNHLSTRVEFALESDKKLLRKEKAALVLQDFFLVNKPKDFQLLHQGTSSFCTDIICVDTDKKENELLFAQSQAQAGLLAFGADENLQDHEKVNGQSPVNLISLKELNPFNLGYLIASWEHRVFLTSRMLQINPFDQYGVSAGKIFARKYLDSNGG